MSLALRYRLFLIASALLYMGPLVAGLAGYDWQMIPVFTAIFLLWLLVMRPAVWPKSMADWAAPAAILTLLGWVLVQAVIVSLCFGIGRGFGFLTTGLLASVPVFVPPLMSLLAIPLARAIWNPAASSPEMDAFLEQATAELTQLGDGRSDTVSGEDALAIARKARQQTTAAPFLADLATLPVDAADAAIDAVLQRSRPELRAAALLEELSALAEAGQITPVQRRAFILLATDIDSADQHLGIGMLAKAFEIAGENGPRLVLFSTRAARLLAAKPIGMMDSPASARVRDAAPRHPLAETALLALADQMDALDAA